MPDGIPTVAPSSHGLTEQELAERKAFLDSYVELALQIWEDLRAEPERYRVFQEWLAKNETDGTSSEISTPDPVISTRCRSESRQTVDGTQQTLPLR